MSPFFQLARVAENDLAFAVRDGFPVSPGHTLVVPKRLVPTWAEATPAERVAVMELAEEVRQQLERELAPDGFNIGINIGVAAGQTVMHLHVHVIPRWNRDVDDPRGGVRFVIPEKGNYKRPGHVPATARLARGETDPFLDHLGPLIGRAEDIRIVAAFVLGTGLDLVRPRLESALERGARVQLLTGDYLNLTQADALYALLDWMQDHEALEARIVEVDGLRGSRSFHPKAWMLAGQGWETVFVGSSNLSRAALTDGVEWNLRSEDPASRLAVRLAFEDLWGRARVLDRVWLEDYARRAERSQRPRPIDLPLEAGPPPQPRDVQSEALLALSRVRGQGRDRAIVALATGLGKTWLAAFDVDQVRQNQGRVPRTLVVAHRRELLTQAARTFRRLFPRERFGWFLGQHDERHGDFVFASVQKLTGRLDAFDPSAFDYIVIDEAHHAAADSYLQLFEHFRPRFWLGLTATPERADSRSIFGLFHDEVAFEADIGVGIGLRHLVPFAYFGLADPTNYAPIPWRNGRFSLEDLSSAVQTHARMERLWQAMEDHPGSRSLVFCCTIGHAEWVRDELVARGLRVVAVHSKPGSADRSWSLDRLERGELDAICTVDLFNEGIDAPMVDRVVMLRPTESSVVFLQQMGRGLRIAEGKKRLVVIDFVGNHHVFLNRVRTLLNLVGTGPVHGVRELKRGPVELPEGCSVTVDLEAVQLLERLLPSGAGHVVVRTYRELRVEWQRRPRAGELSRMGLNPGARGLRKAYASWLAFVASEGDLDDTDLATFRAHEDWFGELGTTNMSKSFKMVTLQALLDEHRLVAGMALTELAQASHAVILRSPELQGDIQGVTDLPAPLQPDPIVWERYWRKNPVRAWTAGRFFRIVEGDLRLTRPPLPNHAEAFQRLTLELVDWRLHAYRRRRASQSVGAAFTCKLLTNQRDPILKLPSRANHALPVEEHDVRLPDGTFWRFRFKKEFVNVARPVGSSRNRLPDLLRTWFGPTAGQPGTEQRVRFAPGPDGWSVEPVLAAASNVIDVSFGRIAAFPELRVAAGWSEEHAGQQPELEELYLPGESDGGTWAVRASGHSMEGGIEPIADGDWLIFRWRRDAPLADIIGRIACIGRGEEGQASYHVKRVVQTPAGVELRSEERGHGSLPASPSDRVLALVERVVRPEQLAPDRLAVGALSELFPWVDDEPPAGWARFGGHLFLVLDRQGQALHPMLVEVLVPRLRPSETAYVCHRHRDSWRYLGVGRSSDGRSWSLAEMDFVAWSALRASGTRGGLSRDLPERAANLAREFVASLHAGSQRVLAGRTLTVLRTTSSGGVRVEDPGRVRERSVSQTDLAWVLWAGEEFKGVLDAARVHQLRYIEGTPRASTRWLDTGYALHLVRGVPSRVPQS